MVYEQLALAAGRALFGLFFMFNGVNHFMKREMMTGYAESKGVPAAGVMVPVTGLLLLAGGLSILAGAYVGIGVALLLVFLAVTTPTMHDFWAVGEEQKQDEMVNFLKNLALLGAVLITYYTWVAAGTWPYAVNAGL
ncbi:MAG: DoxX family membrane protein [Candidatus Nanohaloarchaea archaeon]|nr:DoxX family membrane protein [Candidatus Nanohaloarchaea archaeon]